MQTQEFEVVSAAVLDKPATVDSNVAIEPPKLVTEQELWAYLIANIDEFAVAKTIVDHIESMPDDVQRRHLPLYLRAKVTIKRGHIAYAEAASAVETARKSSSSSIGAGLDLVVKNLNAVWTALLTTQLPVGGVLVAGAAAAAIWLH